MSKENLYELRKKYKESARQTEREYSRQAVGAAPEAIAWPQAKLKSMAGGDDSEWFAQGNLPVWMYAAGNTFLDIAGDPLNAVGAGLFTKGARAARNIAGSGSLRGNTLASASNEVPNHYKPSGNASPTIVDELVMQNQQALSRLPKVGPMVARLENTQDAADAREKATSFIRWLGDSARRGYKQTISPEARANYRQNQVTQTMKEKAQKALDAGTLKEQHRATAQTQYTTNVANQAGRRGEVSEGVDGLNRRSFLTEPEKVTEFSYRDTIKNNKLKGSYGSGKTATVSDQDLDIIGEHVNRVWRDGKGRTVDATPEAEIRIKNAGAGDQVTGAHHADFAAKSGVITSVRRMFGDNKKLSEKELWEKVKAESDANKAWNAKRNPNKQKPKWVLTNRSDTWEGAQEKGIWVTGSFTGTAITEGAANYIAKISPNGRVMAAVSDEHNFLEKVPGVGPLVESALPNRSISVTPPMHYDVLKNKGKIGSVQPQNKADVKESLFDIATAKPSADLLRAERQVNAGAALTATGLLTGGSKNEER